MSKKSLGEHLDSNQVVIVLTAVNANTADFNVEWSTNKSDDPDIESRVEALFCVAAGMVAAAKDNPKKMREDGLKIVQGTLAKEVLSDGK